MIEIPKEVRTTPITAIQARNILQAQTDNYGVFIDFDRLIEYESYYMLLAHKSRETLLKETRFQGLEFTKPEGFASWLANNNVVKNELLLDKTGKKYSFDASKREVLLQSGVLSEEATHLVETYDKGREAQYLVSYLQQYRKLPLSVQEDRLGHRMVVAHPTWSILSTSRIAADNPSIQNIKRTMADLITDPKGMVSVSSDSSQIEPKIVYSWQVPDPIIQDCIKFYDDAYYGILAYCYLPEEAMSDWNPNKWLKQLTSETKEKRQQLKRLTNAANYGGGLKDVDPALRQRYDTRIINHPIRRRNLQQVSNAVASGQTTFAGYFGTKVTPKSTTRYAPGDYGWEGHIERCGINNPIQTTASELMLFSIDAALKLYSEVHGMHICYYKHDESRHYVPEDLVDKVKDRIQGIMSYAVEGWIPIGSDCHVGLKEGDPDIKRLV